MFVETIKFHKSGLTILYAFSHQNEFRKITF